MHCSLIVRDGDTLQLGSCVNCEPCCAFFKTGHRRVLELNFEPRQNNLQASVHACLTERGYVRERRILRISSQISDLKAHPAFRPRGHNAGLWVSHWLQSFKQSKTGKTRRGFYTWLPFVLVQQHAGRPPRVEPSCCEDTRLSKIQIKVSVLELKMQKYTSSWKDDTGEDASVVQSHVEKVNTLPMLEVCRNPCVSCIHLPTYRSTMDRHVGHVVMETSQAQPYNATDWKNWDIII